MVYFFNKCVHDRNVSAKKKQDVAKDDQLSFQSLALQLLSMREHYAHSIQECGLHYELKSS